MEPICFKRNLQQLHSRKKLVFWYRCFNALLYYLIASLFLSLFIRSATLGALTLKFLLAVVFTSIITIYMQRHIKPIFYVSPHSTLTISDSALCYVNDISTDSAIELPFSELMHIDFFMDCRSSMPHSVILKTDSLILPLDDFENMQQIVSCLTSHCPSGCKITWHDTFFPVLHIPSLILFTFYLLLLDLIITFVTPAFYLIIIIVPLSFGIFHLIQTLYTQENSVSWHITKLTTNIIFAVLILLPIIIGLAINLYAQP